MRTGSNKRSTLLSHWTFRYVLTLFVGLVTIGFASVLWIRHDTMKERMNSLKAFTEVAAQYIADGEGEIVIPGDFYEWIDKTQRRYKIPGQFGLTVFDRSGASLFYKDGPSQDSESGNPPPPADPLPASATPSESETGPSAADPVFPSAPPLADEIRVEKTGNMYGISAPVAYGDSIIGTVAISYSYRELAKVNQNYGLIISLLLCSGVLGWIMIYLLSRKLRKPILQLAAALKKMEAGDYQLSVPEHIKEKEIHDFFVSFQAMAARLGKLEELRTELLAGVTHELKTPVASIHGLIHAVRDHVVTSDEAEEFLDISLEQTQRLQHMVSDLLDFNSFASGKISVQTDSIDLGKLLGEIVYQWSLLYQDSRLEVAAEIPERTFMAVGDASRIQQILVNLMNNSRQAMKDEGRIAVSLTEHSDQDFEILVQDNGPGIPEDEQANIFERYFRGERKKHSVGGLGLGLTYSRMLAVAMNGRLALKRSTPEGATFQLLLPKQNPA
ncbi:ATP-binding protein [Paenibacillus sepulcri]|uniref:histidine kinase n=1 Tax=Paenibacillus sepulcri TaxID=359917 RepID=A0ABS7C3T6_9BACL|nr:HAMP domain-containing histidine kinase [Paenibacillus sepulcri]